MNHILRAAVVLVALSTSCTTGEVDRSTTSDATAMCFVLGNTLRAHDKTLNTVFPQGTLEPIRSAASFQPVLRRLDVLIDGLAAASADPLGSVLTAQISGEADAIRDYLHSTGDKPRAAYRTLAARLDVRGEFLSKVADDVEEECGSAP
jgi:hypothetical protein